MKAIDCGLSLEQIKNAAECYLVDDYQLYILPDVNGDVYCLSRYGLNWYIRDNESFWYVWDCDYSLYLPLSGAEAVDLIEKWQKNQQNIIHSLENQLNELRQLLADKSKIGSNKQELSKYYSEKQDELYELQFDNDLKGKYWEVVGLYKDIFVEYYFDEKNLCIYQCAAHGEIWLFKYADCDWLRIGSVHTEKLQKILRHAAEGLVDKWINEKCGNVNIIS